MHPTILSVPVLLAAFTAAPVMAIPTIYTDIASFDSALGAPSDILDDFNDVSTTFGGFTQLTLPINRGDYSLTNQIGTIWANDGPLPNTVDGSDFLLLGNLFLNRPAGFTVSFSSPVIAFGFDYARGSGGNDPNLDVTSGVFNQTLTVQDPAQFFGVIFDAPVSSVSLRKVPGSFAAVDNFRIPGQAAVTVPEPGTAVLVGLGLAGLTLRARRRWSHR